MVQPQFSFLFNCLSVISFDNIPIEHYLCLDSDPKTEIDNLEYIRQIIPLMLNCRGYVPYGYYDHRVVAVWPPPPFCPISFSPAAT